MNELDTLRNQHEDRTAHLLEGAMKLLTQQDLLKRALTLIDSTTYDGNSGPIIEHTRLHKLHDIHLPERPCEACELVEEIRTALEPSYIRLERKGYS